MQHMGDHYAIASDGTVGNDDGFGDEDDGDDCGHDDGDVDE